MITNRKHWIQWAAAALVGFTASTQAAVIWNQDFSDVSNWTVIFDPGGGSSLTSNGTEGLFYVNAGTSSAAFVPVNTGTQSLVPFDPGNASDYAMTFTVASVTGSTSYDIVLDEFDGDGNYIATVFGVVPQSAFVGSDTISLGSFSFDVNTSYLAPKIDVYTGLGAQTVAFSQLEFTVVPEPCANGLVLAGAGLLLYGRPRRARLRKAPAGFSPGI